MRKVKFTASNWHDRLAKILEDFPKVDDVHPFYADLMNVLYDRDHYKLALGQLATAKRLMDQVATDYVRLLKYGDSLYRCKALKRAALGRMATLMRRQGPSLAYLEQVRQHLSRLPSIDPAARTLLVCGYPNVGKSSFVNRVTRAEVEVQPYAFTTKSLFVGHADYRYLRWQVIDTPGVLDRPLEERNTIEMQAVTALAHLRAAVLYVVDVSEQCGYTLAQQAALFHSIKPLFAGKPTLVVCNKTDARPLADLSPEEHALLNGMAAEAARLAAGGAAGGAGDAGAESALITMSALTEEGVAAVKAAACERLLASRVEVKLRSKRAADVAGRIHVAMPRGHDPAARPAVVPPGLAAARAARDAGARRRTEKDEQEAAGGAGVYSQDLRKLWDLADPAWRHDVVPEIWAGHNLADFVDADIDARLEALEREEEAAAAAFLAAAPPEEPGLDEGEAATLAAIRDRKRRLVAAHRRLKKEGTNKAPMPRPVDTGRARTAKRMVGELGAMGLDARAAAAAAPRSRSRGRSLTRKRAAAGDAEMAEAGAPAAKRVHSSKSRSMSRGRSLSEAPAKGLRDGVQANRAIKMGDRAQRSMSRGRGAAGTAKKGEGDRHIPTLRPKHLFSGKRGKGSTDWR
jgi:nucleolar GTP-binding protein